MPADYPRRVTDYCILTSTTLLILQGYVNDFIKQGWIPQGGISVGKDNYFQAMIKLSPLDLENPGPL